MEEAKQTFDVDKAAVLVNGLRKTFSSGKTKSYEWRMSQLESISKMIDEKEKEIIEALHKDLSKPELEAFLSEVCILHSSLNTMLMFMVLYPFPFYIYLTKCKLQLFYLQCIAFSCQFMVNGIFCVLSAFK